ncbi:MAG: ribosomal L7Ae/L30e/S12e/Gadd45 family protein [Gemmatimonadetes bacterium]|nr:ribosomal L7Ae/L30e/S12e/Gadd45 family protein [Gemmatimonadota bacterium]
MAGAESEALALLGLAARAGAVVAGAVRVREAARGGGVQLVIVAADASANSQDRVVPALQAMGVPIRAAFDRDRLGAAIGRSAVSAVGVTDGQMARRLIELLGAGAGIEPRARRDGR